MTLYELNQAGYTSLPPLSDEGWGTARAALLQYLTTFESNYYMLLNNELHYYTIFTWESKVHDCFTLADEIISIAKALGKVKAIERNGETVEFWIETDGECNMYVLFDYERGVVAV